MSDETFYTAFVAWPRFAPGPYGQDVEEIDVDASSEAEARRLVSEELARDYVPGGKIVELQRRYKGIIYF